jgi:molybdopterin molybdotransferase
MVTFYQFVRDALLVLAGADPVEPLPTFTATCTARLKKAPGRTEFQRGILSRAADGTLTVKPTGEQGSGILKSMSDANCFIILPDATGNVEPGTAVQVQPLEGLV